MSDYAVRPYRPRQRRAKVRFLTHPATALGRPQGGVRPYDPTRFRRRPRPGAHRIGDRGGLVPVDADYAMTADVVIDDPREPQIVPTGVLDERGMMICRVSMPLKVKMGFHSRHQPEPDEVVMMVPEDMLQISDCGAGMDYFDEDDLGDDE